MASETEERWLKNLDRREDSRNSVTAVIALTWGSKHFCKSESAGFECFAAIRINWRWAIIAALKRFPILAISSPKN